MTAKTVQARNLKSMDTMTFADDKPQVVDYVFTSGEETAIHFLNGSVIHTRSLAKFKIQR